MPQSTIAIVGGGGVGFMMLSYAVPS